MSLSSTSTAPRARLAQLDGSICVGLRRARPAAEISTVAINRLEARAFTAHRKYSDDFKAEVLAEYQRVGLNQAERRMGVAKTTILRWLDRSGVPQAERDEVRDSVAERNRQAAIAKTAKVDRERAEARERVVGRLAKVSEGSLIRELELLAAGGFTREDLQALTNARMKAIQQFELLDGRPTGRRDVLIEHQLNAVFMAFTRTLAVIPVELHDRVTELFSTQLRELADANLALEHEPDTPE